MPAAVWARVAQGTELGAALWGMGNVRFGDHPTNNELDHAAAALKNDVAKIAASGGLPEEVRQSEAMKRAEELAAQSGTMSQQDAKALAQVAFSLAQALGRHVKDVDGLQLLNRITVESEKPGRPTPPSPRKALDAAADAAAEKARAARRPFDNDLGRGAAAMDAADPLMNEVPWAETRDETAGEAPAPEVAEAPEVAAEAPAQAAPAAEARAADAPDMVVGKPGVLVLADGTRMEFDYVVMEMDDASFSHDPVTHNPNPNYQGKQERAREDFDSRIFAAQTVIPELVNTESATAESGPPIIDRNKTVHGGYMRGAIVYGSYTKGDGLYRRHLDGNSRQFGIEPEAFAHMRKPGLFRRLRQPVADPAQFSVMLNRSMTMGKNLMETAVSRGAFVGANVLEVMADAGEDETTAAFLDRRGADLAQAMIKDGAFDKAEVGEYLDADGKLTAEGRLAAEYMMLGHLVPSRKALTSLSPAARNKIIATAAAFIRTRGNPDYDLSRLVAGVAAHLVQKAGKSWEEYGPGASLFGDAYAVAPEGAAYELAKFFDTHTAGEIRAALDAYAAMVPPDAASGDLFGGSFYDPAEALGRALGVDPARLDDNGRHAEVVKGRLAQAAMHQHPAGDVGGFVDKADAGGFASHKAFLTVGDDYAFAPGVRFDLPSDTVTHVRQEHAGQETVRDLDAALRAVQPGDVAPGGKPRYSGKPWLFYASVNGKHIGGAFEVFPSGRALVTTIFEGTEAGVRNWLAKSQGALDQSGAVWSEYLSSLAHSPADNQSITPNPAASSENPGGALYQGAGAPWFQKFPVSELAGPGDAREGRASARPDLRLSLNIDTHQATLVSATRWERR